MTFRCVDSIFQTCQHDFTIYIVDNGSKNDSYQRLTDQYQNNDKVVLISSENLGYATGNNVGIRQAMKDGHNIITVTNNDVIFLEESIALMYSFLDQNKDAAVVAPYILSPEGILHNLPAIKPVKPMDYLYFTTRLNKLVPGKRKSIYDNEYILTSEAINNRPIPIYKFSGCCFMAKSEVLEELGLFDEQTFLYFEEDILCFKMNQAGYKAYFLPDSKIIHHHGLTTGKDNLFVDTEMLISEIYFLSKYFHLKLLPLFYLYIDRALTPLMKKIRHGYGVSYKEYFDFLGKTWRYFNKYSKLRKVENREKGI